MSYVVFLLPKKTGMGTPGCVCHLTGLQDVASCIQSSNRDASFFYFPFFFFFLSKKQNQIHTFSDTIDMLLVTSCIDTNRPVESIKIDIIAYMCIYYIMGI